MRGVCVARAGGRRQLRLPKGGEVWVFLPVRGGTATVPGLAGEEGGNPPPWGGVGWGGGGGGCTVTAPGDANGGGAAAPPTVGPVRVDAEMRRF